MQPCVAAAFDRQVNTQLSTSMWETFHTYRFEWKAGDGGFMRWSLDGKLQFELEAATVATPRTVHFDMHGEQTPRPRTLPTEPMYLILNVDLSPKWGWPAHCTDEEAALGCECCFDCRSLACTRCIVTDASTGVRTNTREWFAALCDDLPTSYLIDYVRVYQRPTAANDSVGCDPPSHPTRQYIRDFEAYYKLPDADESLTPVVPGGGACLSSDDCGPASSSSLCYEGQCVCTSVDYTGPLCRSQSAGDARECHAFERQARVTAT